MATHSILAPSFTARRSTISVGAFWAVARAMLQARHTRRLLAEMEPRLLADIGTSPSDARNEAARPFWDLGGR